MSSGYLVPLIRHMTQTDYTSWFSSLVNSPQWPAVTHFFLCCTNQPFTQLSKYRSLSRWMTFFPGESTSLFLWGIQPDASEQQAPQRLGGACRVLNISWKHRILFLYLLLSHRKTWKGFATRPWSPVVETWTQEIAFFDSEPYLIIETSLAWCCSTVFSLCNLFYREESETERNVKETQTLVGKGKYVIHQVRASCRVCSRC